MNEHADVSRHRTSRTSATAPDRGDRGGTSDATPPQSDGNPHRQRDSTVAAPRHSHVNQPPSGSPSARPPEGSGRADRGGVAVLKRNGPAATVTLTIVDTTPRAYRRPPAGEAAIVATLDMSSVERPSVTASSRVATLPEPVQDAILAEAQAFIDAGTGGYWLPDAWLLDDERPLPKGDDDSSYPSRSDTPRQVPARETTPTKEV